MLRSKKRSGFFIVAFTIKLERNLSKLKQNYANLTINLMYCNFAGIDKKL